jgi:Ca2+-binding RTX toxin-like protein
LIGGSGDDLLVGGNGDDTLVGGEGDDELYGSNGINRLRGGPGEDLYSLGGTSNAVIITVADAVGQPIDRVIGFISGLDHFELEHPDLTPGSLDPAHFLQDTSLTFTGTQTGSALFVVSHWNGSTFDSYRRLWACYETGAACTALANLGIASAMLASDILVI